MQIVLNLRSLEQGQLRVLALDQELVTVWNQFLLISGVPESLLKNREIPNLNLMDKNLVKDELKVQIQISIETSNGYCLSRNTKVDDCFCRDRRLWKKRNLHLQVAIKQNKFIYTSLYRRIYSNQTYS